MGCGWSRRGRLSHILTMVDNQKYEQVLEGLYGRLQAFHRVGGCAYKPGLGTTRALSAAFGNPHDKFATIHVGGTNGKGSTAHLLASVLTCAGYRTGLYTSPHLVDFNERIRIDGQPISHDDVVDFVQRWENMHLNCSPSFFELATIMAFDYFARQQVDVAVIEVGLGGRLDSTNIINPLLSVITNISLDHTAILGDSEPAIAREKAGIIKPRVPVVIGECNGLTRPVFEECAQAQDSPVIFATDNPEVISSVVENDTLRLYTAGWGHIDDALTGDCQHANANTVLTALRVLSEHHMNISADAVKDGFARVCDLTGLAGRWMTLSDEPRVICDTGHNPGAWRYLSPRLTDIAAKTDLKVVLGFVGDKDFGHIIPTLPADATYYFVTPSTPRAESSHTLCLLAKEAGLDALCFDSVEQGYEQALADSGKGSVIFVGGSTFVVADLINALRKRDFSAKL